MLNPNPIKQEQLTAFLRSEKAADWKKFSVNLPAGLIIELGVASGGTFRVLCETFKYRLCYGFDWFHGLSEPWHGNDTGAFSTHGVVPTSPPNGVYVVGLVQDTLAPFLQVARSKVSFVHFDMDLYNPTRHCLMTLDQYFQERTVLVFDEINGPQSMIDNEQKAFREWLDATGFDIENLGHHNTYGHAFRLTRK